MPLPPTPPPATRSSGFRSAALIVVLVTGLVYARAAGAGFVWDDHSVIETRRLSGVLSEIPALFTHNAIYVVGLAPRAGMDTYRPLPLATFFFEESLVGRRPALFHIDNVLIHIGAALLLLLVARALGAPPRVGLFAALAFAVHPAISEAVYWINGRSDPLCVLFFLGALLAWLRGHQIAVAALVLLSTLSKETAFLLIPPIVLLAPLRHAPSRRLAITLLPWLAGAAAGIAFRWGALRQSGIADGSRHLSYGLLRLPVVVRDALSALLFPAAEMPMALELRYRTLSPGGLASGGLVVIALGALAGWCLRRGRRIEAWAIATFLLATAPVALLTYLRGYVGWGRYLYPSAPALALALAIAVAGGVAPRLGSGPRRLLGGAAAALIILFAVQTFVAADDWHDERAFSTALLLDHPEDPTGHLRLAHLEEIGGRPEIALGHVNRAAMLDPLSDIAWSQLAHFLMILGRREEAYAAASRALSLRSDDPVSARIVAIALLERGQEAAAARLLVAAVASNPGDEGSMQTLREAAGRLGATSEFVITLKSLLREARFSTIATSGVGVLSPPPPPQPASAR